MWQDGLLYCCLEKPKGRIWEQSRKKCWKVMMDGCSGVISEPVECAYLLIGDPHTDRLSAGDRHHPISTYYLLLQTQLRDER